MSSGSSTADRGPGEFVAVARLHGAHGVSGELRVEVLTENPKRFEPGSRLFLHRPDGSRRPVRVAGSRPHGRGLLVALEGISDRDAARALSGSTLEVAGDELEPAAAGSFYLHELEDYLCHDLDAGPLGRVSALIEGGGGLLLEIRDGRRRVLVPFVRSYVKNVDRERRRVDLELPPGLIESCASTS